MVPELWPIDPEVLTLAVRHRIAARIRDGMDPADIRSVVNDAEGAVKARVRRLTQAREQAEYAMTGVMRLDGQVPKPRRSKESP